MRYLVLFAVLVTVAAVAFAALTVALAGWGTDPMARHLTT